MEQKQDTLLTFLTKASQNPTFVEHLAHKLESMDVSVDHKKRRFETVRLETVRVETVPVETVRVKTVRVETVLVETVRVETVRVKTIRSSASKKGSQE
ncbi:hypothetical protein HanHA300_Chr11g0385101 [Helianthus annuus]|nr:hypothetical protein HanHA300_Chr11g0385101 [Helianthus annuus]KAJ0507349.1 hypothetical protein HanIR_Chr11g0505291 [Helianthus annuus]KAJ0515852.1 hypothetical protein HanHA89_Chr11g0407401 [Helianthus annuus]KAJ0687832.1 hypothetical protein HanOQP8_Chr11g0387761 [Helianthus annuus]